LDTFWAKTPIESQTNVSWDNIHSVFHHAIDVGLTAQILMDTRFASLQRVLYRPFADEQLGSRCISCLAALHDIGKITAVFQNKVVTLGSDLFRRGYPVPLMTVGHKAHGQDTSEFLYGFFQNEWPDCDLDIITACVQIAAAHHGYFYSPSADERIQDAWEIARNDHALAICDVWFSHGEVIPPPDYPEWVTPQWTMLGAGLVSVADWIGSSLEFPVEADSLEMYIAVRKDQILNKLQAAGLINE
jgi:CRISPR-associated endonuclease Cas3-HD